MNEGTIFHRDNNRAFIYLIKENDKYFEIEWLDRNNRYI